MGFINEPLLKYNYNKFYRLFLIKQLDIVDDIKNIINLILSIEDVREFKIPDYIDWHQSKYVDNDGIVNKVVNDKGIVFEKVRYKLGFQHCKDKECIVRVVHGKILDVKCFYREDLHHYYKINFKKSGLKNIKINGYVKILYKKIVLHYHIIDPLLIGY